MWLAQLEEEDTDDGEEQESDDPDGIKGVMEEFIAAALNILSVIAHL